MSSPSSIRFFPKLLELALVAAGFGAATELYNVIYPDKYGFLTQNEAIGGFLLSVTTFWLVLRLHDGTGPEDRLLQLVDQFCLGTGAILIVQAVLNYFQLLTRSLFLILIGGLISSLLLAIARWLLHGAKESKNRGVLLLGFHPLAAQLAALLKQPIIGVVGGSNAAAGPVSIPGIPWLGEVGQFEQIVAQHAPAQILVASPEAVVALTPKLLLNYRLSGCQVSEVPVLYENLFHRVYCQGLNPAELVLSPALQADSRAMATQAIYTNLLGLLLLLALAPVLVAVALVVALFSGPGPIMDGFECAGFQNIPFRLLRFRTLRTDGSGALTRVGRVLSRLRLVNLPLLINIVRGEMALFGPAPVRRELARRLTELLPFYSLRFSVKPGFFGWAQLHLTREGAPHCEILRTEYDLFYVKEASPTFDLEIVVRILTGGTAGVPATGLLEAGH